MKDDIAIDHLRTWVGKQICGNDIITSETLNRFRATLAGFTELSTEPPLGIHWCLAQPAAAHDELGSDGHPSKGGFMPPVALPRRMWASSHIRFHSMPELETPIEKTSTIADVFSKQSASSGQLVFVHIDHAYVQNHQNLIDERQTIVYRQPSAYKPPKPSAPENRGSSFQLVPDSTLLFRYSAMTFNAHRIHYDYNYATKEEGYPGLVVQGPLMATLLMNLAQASRPKQTIMEFEFTGVAPAFVDHRLNLAVRDSESPVSDALAEHNGQVSLEIRNQEHALIMKASANFRDDNEY